MCVEDPFPFSKSVNKSFGSDHMHCEIEYGSTTTHATAVQTLHEPHPLIVMDLICNDGTKVVMLRRKFLGDHILTKKKI